MKKLFLLFTIFFIYSNIYAQTVQFTATSEKVVQVGEQFQLVYQINQQGSGFRPPDLSDFMAYGPSTSQNMSSTFINGKMSTEVSYSYTYVLQAKKDGRFTIKPAEITINGKKYSSNSVTIEVVKGQTQATNPQAGTNQPANTGNANNADMFLRLNLDKTTLYQGEQIVATIKIYTRENLAGFDNMKLPTYNGFWTQDIDIPKQISLNRENVGGQIYQTGVLKQTILVPQRSGDINIEAFDITCVVNKPTGRRDFFGRPMYGEAKVKVNAPAKTIKVKALPGNKPASFEGAVGTFKMQATIDKQDVKTNDGITLKVILSGTGNIKLIDPIKVKFPGDFDTFDPQINNKLTTTANGISGTKSIEYLAIPRSAGDFTIGPIEFSYFDPKTEKYTTLSSEAFKIHVEKGSSDTTRIVSGFTKENVKIIGSDIHFIRINDYKLSKKGDVFFGTNLYWMLYLIPFILFVVVFIWQRKRIQENANLRLQKNKYANKISRKRLKDAEKYLKANQKEQFYEEILKASWGYLSDKLYIPVSELTKENVAQTLEKHNIDAELIQQFIGVLDISEFARFAPVGAGEEMHKVFDDAITIISKLEQKLK